MRKVTKIKTTDRAPKYIGRPPLIDTDLVKENLRERAVWANGSPNKLLELETKMRTVHSEN